MLLLFITFISSSLQLISPGVLFHWRYCSPSSAWSSDRKLRNALLFFSPGKTAKCSTAPPLRDSPTMLTFPYWPLGRFSASRDATTAKMRLLFIVLLWRFIQKPEEMLEKREDDQETHETVKWGVNFMGVWSQNGLNTMTTFQDHCWQKTTKQEVHFHKKKN